MDNICPELSVLLIILVLYVCACFVAIGVLCTYKSPGDSQARCVSSDIRDSGIDSSVSDNSV